MLRDDHSHIPDATELTHSSAVGANIRPSDLAPATATGLVGYGCGTLGNGDSEITEAGREPMAQPGSVVEDAVGRMVADAGPPATASDELSAPRQARSGLLVSIRD